MIRTATILVMLATAAMGQELPRWQKGIFEIHHIHTGSGNAAFFVFPDGTTMLFDAGEVDRSVSSRRSNPLRIAPAVDSSAALAIKKYIEQVRPHTRRIDYVVISHFHPDHYGALPELTRYFKIGKLIDRNYPTYDYPVDLRKHSFDSVGLRKYVAAQQGISVESLAAGRSDQIVSPYPGFLVRNIKNNGDIWTGAGTTTRKIIPEKIDVRDYNENPLSIALKISYGDFDYFTGGDMTGLSGFGLPSWFDTETPVAQVVGRVDVLSLNHHGVRDATNEAFISTLGPRVIVQQSWSSNHPGEEVLHRIISPVLYPGPRDIFATYVHEETKVTYGRWLTDNYKVTEGHIVVRVEDGGKEFSVFSQGKKFGPFQSK